MGTAMFTIIAAMAELERSVIRERVVAGLEYARTQGTRSGKAIGRPRVVFHRDQVIQPRAQGLSWRQIAKAMGVGTTTVRKVYQDQMATVDKLATCQNPVAEIL